MGRMERRRKRKRRRKEKEEEKEKEKEKGEKEKKDEEKEKDGEKEEGNKGKTEKGLTYVAPKGAQAMRTKKEQRAPFIHNVDNKRCTSASSSLATLKKKRTKNLNHLKIPKKHSHKSQNHTFSSSSSHSLSSPPHYADHRLRLINLLARVMSVRTLHLVEWQDGTRSLHWGKELVRCEFVENNFEQADVEQEKEKAAWRNRTHFEEGDAEEEEEEEKEEKEEKKK
ncbi:uncharacterized protein MONOS_12065 [Monocercomonoides exilis]|uniref:uncharacterized protein n=1 Tax=Monocercomonoides exilis TaxID=2049356 RepID=UPI003559E65A|nr:hypothetical protein MONOS_12065 [Monocercomonoides exilis]|eukprot:MONOS_12065.1-p1 / transcript=MONOS_12065.1 / gene=MONOS_12065 / organism=Monocercomonoides_exilis_PA203 / gene_product=unspecified product / transcript_product=unspecified product / location=Mono_scaffold00641:29899-30838(-) / protein_length=225 / sequence_SO=supercontig / SO=protein_coding / is_pseudo=false